jgi:hypothetical protein
MLGCRLGPAFARDVQDNLWYAIHLQQGLSIGRQLITGKERNIPATHSLKALEEHIGALLITFAHNKRGYQAPYRREGNPYPGIALERQHPLGYRQMGFFLTYEAPQFVHLALGNMQGIEQIGGDSPTMPPGAIEPVTDGILIDLDDAASAPQ